MKAARVQIPIRFTADADPRYCAKGLCRARRLKHATHVVTIGKQIFRLCTSCARPYESVRGAKVEVIIREGAANA